MKHRLIVSLTVLVVLFMSTPSHAYFVSTSAGDFDVTTTTGTFSALQDLLKDQAWWGDQTLANEFATAVNNNLGTPNSLDAIYGPLFAAGRKAGANNVLASAWSNGLALDIAVTDTDTLTWATATEVTVPVPAAAWLFGSALGLLGWIRRRST